MLYIIVKHVIWRIRLYSLFRQIFKYRENMNNNRFHEIHKSFSKSQNLNILRNKLYIRNPQITCFKMIYDMFMFCESDIFSNSRK